MLFCREVWKFWVGCLCIMLIVVVGLFVFCIRLVVLCIILMWLNMVRLVVEMMFWV